MKKTALSISLTLVLVSALFLLNISAEDYTQWELPDGAIARLGKGGIKKIQYSSDNRFLAVESTIGIWIYDVVTLQEALLFAGNTNWINCVSLSPDGRTFAVGTGQVLQLWDTIIGEHQATLTGHTNGIFDVVFSSDGQTLATGSSDGTIRLWDTHTGEQKKHSQKVATGLTRSH